MTPRFAQWREPERVTAREVWDYAKSKDGRLLFVITAIAVVGIPGLFLWARTSTGRPITGSDLLLVLGSGLFLGLLQIAPLLAIAPASCAKRRFLTHAGDPSAFACTVSIRRGAYETGTDFGVATIKDGRLVFRGLVTNFGVSHAAAQDFVRDKPRTGSLRFRLVDSPLEVTVSPAMYPTQSSQPLFKIEQWQAWLSKWQAIEGQLIHDDLYPPKSPLKSAWGGPRGLLILGAAFIFLGALRFALPYIVPDLFRSLPNEMGPQIASFTIFALLGLGMIVPAIVWWRKLNELQREG